MHSVPVPFCMLDYSTIKLYNFFIKLSMSRGSFMILEYVVKDNRYQNINQILKQEFHISTRLLHKLIVEKHVLLNNCISDTRVSVSER